MSADRQRKLLHRRSVRWELDDCSEVDPLAEYLAVTFALGLRPVEVPNLQWMQLVTAHGYGCLEAGLRGHSSQFRSVCSPPRSGTRCVSSFRCRGRRKVLEQRGGRVLATEYGDPLNPRAVIRRVHVLCGEANLPHARLACAGTRSRAGSLGSVPASSRRWPSCDSPHRGPI